jgi:hypothetical protein
MSTKRNPYGVAMCLLLIVATTSSCTTIDTSLPAGLEQRHQLWNNFADKLLTVHKKRLQNTDYYTMENVGGYGGLTNDPEYYREVKYFDRESRQLLSVVKWKLKFSINFHMIDLFIYDDKNRIKREYTVTYLPSRRTSPSEALIIFHYYRNNLHSIREFDASNVLLYEQCNDTAQANKVIFSFDYVDIPESYSDLDPAVQAVYRACFDHAAISAEPFLDPLVELSALK